MSADGWVSFIDDECVPEFHTGDGYTTLRIQVPPISESRVLLRNLS